MKDRLSKAERSRHMARIRGKNTKPELQLRQGLHRAGIRFRLHRRDLVGRPDLVLAKYNAAIFVHGCFWHRHSGCALAYDPKTRTDFWNQKFAENIARDLHQIRLLRDRGWRTCVVWECGLRSIDNRDRTIKTVIDWLRSTWQCVEIPSTPRRPTIRATKPRYEGCDTARTAPYRL